VSTSPKPIKLTSPSPTISVPPEEDDEATRNSGTNLFVTGIHPRLTEGDVARLFEKYGEVEKCNIMKDPHTRESRGFGFVNFFNSQQADAAKEGLQGEVYEGRTLSIEKARRSKPRTPTPGKYFGPPKRGMSLILSISRGRIPLTSHCKMMSVDLLAVDATVIAWMTVAEVVAMDAVRTPMATVPLVATVIVMIGAMAGAVTVTMVLGPIATRLLVTIVTEAAVRAVVAAVNTMKGMLHAPVLLLQLHTPNL